MAGKVGANFWVANAEVATEVVTTLAGQDLERPIAEMTDAARRAIEVVAALGLRPVLVVDDSDAFTRGRDENERQELVSAFFGRTLSALTKLDCGLLVALSQEDAGLGQFSQALEDFGALQRFVDVPETVSGHLRQILERRVELLIGRALEDVLAPDALEALSAFNREQAQRNLRTVLSIAHEALALSIGRDLEQVDSDAVQTAARHRLQAGAQPQKNEPPA